MRHRLLTGAVLALLAWPATGHAQSGGASVPAPTGGAGYGISVPSLKASRFKVAPRTITLGAPVSFRYRVDGSRQSVRVRVELLPIGSRHPGRAHPHGLEAHRPHADPHAGRRPPAS